MKTDRQKLAFILECQLFRLNDWEMDFLDSIDALLCDPNEDLSWKQSKKLGEIYRRAESVEG